MKTRQLGQGLTVSALGLGCMGMSNGVYGQVEEKASLDALQTAIDLGINFLDTADMYGWGENEKLIGKIIKNQRAKIVLATKMGFVKTDDGFAIDTTPTYIKAACDASLKRLGVDYIDLYYLHRVDGKTPVEESMQVMADLVKSGKIRHVGISDVKPETIRRAHKIHPLTALETEYSLWQREPEQEILPICWELGIGFVPYSPLGRGFLTGNVTDVNTLAADDFRRILPKFQGDNFIENQKIISKLTEIAQEKHCTLAQLSLAWLLAQNKSIVPIPGTKKSHYIKENIGALNVKLSAEDLKIMDDIFKQDLVKGEKYPAHLNFEN